MEKKHGAGSSAGQIAIRRHISLDGEKITTLDDLYIDMAEKLQFPDYFGHNLDALADCLGDAGPVRITVRHWRDFLFEEEDETKDIVAGMRDGLENVHWER